MAQVTPPANRIRVGQQSPQTARSSPISRVSLRVRSIVASVIAAFVLIGLIALGSRGFRWFDVALIGYAMATVIAVATVTYKYTFWLRRPPTARYWWRSWQMFFSRENFRRYAGLVPGGILSLFAQRFIQKRSTYRWITHQCIFWGVILSCAITFPLTFGWLRFTQATPGPDALYRIWVFGFPLITLPVGSILAILVYHALDITALILIVGLVLAFHRRFHDLALVTVQRFSYDMVPLILLMSIAVTGLALTLDSTLFEGAFYWYISLTHQLVVVIWLISLPFGKFFHLIERPATVGVELYWKTGEASTMQQCARCKEDFAPVHFIQDLKKTLYEVNENYSLEKTSPGVPLTRPNDVQAEEQATRTLWWQDFCPSCKRIMRAQANLAALGPDGNKFL